MTPPPLVVRAGFSATILRRVRRLLLEERRARLDWTGALVGPPQPDSALTLEWHLVPMLIAHSRREIDEIDQALARIPAGTYGWCEACQQRLAIARLEATPQTRWCEACQSNAPPSVVAAGARCKPDGL